MRSGHDPPLEDTASTAPSAIFRSFCRHLQDQNLSAFDARHEIDRSFIGAAIRAFPRDQCLPQEGGLASKDEQKLPATGWRR